MGEPFTAQARIACTGAAELLARLCARLEPETLRERTPHSARLENWCGEAALSIDAAGRLVLDAPQRPRGPAVPCCACSWPSTSTPPWTVPPPPSPGKAMAPASRTCPISAPCVSPPPTRHAAHAPRGAGRRRRAFRQRAAACAAAHSAGRPHAGWPHAAPDGRIVWPGGGRGHSPASTPWAGGRCGGRHAGARHGAAPPARPRRGRISPATHGPATRWGCSAPVAPACRRPACICSPATRPRCPSSPACWRELPAQAQAVVRLGKWRMRASASLCPRPPGSTSNGSSATAPPPAPATSGAGGARARPARRP